MRLNKKCLVAIKDYYFNRYRNTTYKTPWNKESDLNRIVLYKPSKTSFVAIAGTFIFKCGKQEIWITEETYPEGTLK
jgi:hypothetical protein